MALGDGFYRIKRLPPYVFAQVQTLKLEARQRGEDIIDFGMGNPDQPTPDHIVDKLIEASKKAKNHRYSASRGITKLRHAITGWYKRNYDVELDPETEAIVTIGSKEGLAHLALATIGPGDVVLTPTPTYPIHMYSFIIAGGEVRGIELRQDSDFFDDLQRVYRQTLPRPRILVINFPHNPTTAVVDLEFFKKIVAFAKEHDVIVIHDLAYADIAFDGYKAPSFLQVSEAKEVGVEFYTLSKAYNMPGWRVGFCVGNREVVGALAKIKSYLDYGIFQPIQIASTVALNGPQDCVKEVVQRYQNRRNVLVNGLNRIGWSVALPRATMFVWARIPDPYRHMGSLEFSKLLLKDAKVAVSPGIGFGEGGDEFVRFALVENEHRTRQALRGIRKALKLDGQES
ncbi:MAG: Aspartate aminotransferase [Nitrospira sp.]|jgi:alanine-synthesizing transaminase|nr:MAG: Aspartate aminotransferase [Nitrospira sp.]